MTSPLPDLLCLSPHRTVLPRGSQARQLGLDPERAVVAEGLMPALALMLDELDGPVSPADLVTGAVRRGAPAADAESLLRTLFDGGVVVDAGAAVRQRQCRAESTVVVTGDGPLAVGVVIGLLQAGVGTVHAQVSGTVLAGDLGTGLLDADRGSDRSDAVAAAARRTVAGAVVEPPPLRLLPDLVVLADAQAPDPAETVALHADGIPHLLVRLRDGTGVVGPLVLPRRSACVDCLELHRRRRDGGWPGVAAQLVGRPGRADPACTAATAALGTAQALAALDGAEPPPTLDATIELDVATARMIRRHWTPRPDCTCGAAPAGGPRHPRATCRTPPRRGTLSV